MTRLLWFLALTVADRAGSDLLHHPKHGLALSPDLSSSLAAITFDNLGTGFSAVAITGRALHPTGDFNLLGRAFDRFSKIKINSNF